jgi:very-short-patch-repair endonuclease
VRPAGREGLIALKTEDLTDTERKLWTYLRANRLGGLKFRRQHPVGPYVADFYCHEARLVVEVDGPVHDNHRRHDLQRDQWMDANGYNVMRLENARVWHHLPEVLVEIAEAARVCKEQRKR